MSRPEFPRTPLRGLTYRNLLWTAGDIHESPGRRRRAAHGARNLGLREATEMSQLSRITPGELFRPFEDPTTLITRGDRLITRKVYGSERVKDHFVDISAQPPHEMDMEHDGVVRFGSDGGIFVVPNLKPLGEGSEEDPLCEVKIHIYTDTVRDPAVGEQHAFVVIDGKKYIARVEREISSHYFDNPGHDVHFEGFDPEGDDLNLVRLTEKQEEAYKSRSDRESRIVRGVINRAVNDGSFIDGLNPLDAEAARRIEEANRTNAEEQAVLDGIIDNPRIGSISTGALLLVPRSMLDSVEVCFPVGE